MAPPHVRPGTGVTPPEAAGVAAVRRTGRRARVGRRDRRGASILYTYLFVTLACGIGTLAVDYGHMQVVKAQLQRCADVTARGSIENYMRNGLTSAQASAAGLAAANPVDAGFGTSPTVQVTWGYWNSSTNSFVAGPGTPVACQVVASRTAANGNAVPVILPVFVNGQANHPTNDITATAVAIPYTQTLLNYPAGFGGTGTQPTLVGSTALVGTHLRLTQAITNQTGAAWSTTKVPIGTFSTSFSFQQTSAYGDGCAFVIQNQSPTALGIGGGGLGYMNLTHAVCVKFDIYSNAGEGTDSTGFYTGGAYPDVPSIDLTPSGVVLRSGHLFNAAVAYDGKTLTWTITDSTNPASTMTNSATANLPALIGGSTAYVGFTGAGGGFTSQQDILTWVYSIATPQLKQ